MALMTSNQPQRSLLDKFVTVPRESDDFIQDSTGSRHCIRNGDWTFRDMVGPALERWSAQGGINECAWALLNRHASRFASLPTLTIDPWMVQKYLRDFVPTLLISCEDDGARRIAYDLLRKCRIIRRSSFVIMHMRNPIPVFALSSYADGIGSILDWRIMGAPPVSDSLCGVQITARPTEPDRADELKPLSRATIGGVIRIGPGTFGLTVAHPFVPQPDDNSDDGEEELRDVKIAAAYALSLVDDLNESEEVFEQRYSDDEDDDGNDEDDDDFLSNEICLQQEHSTSSSRVSGPEEPKGPRDIQDVNSGLRDIAMVINYSPRSSDWAILKLNHDTLEPVPTSNEILIDGKPACICERQLPMSNAESVLALARNGRQLRGEISSSPSLFKDKSVPVFQQAYRVRFEEQIDHGDSGAWVIRPKGAEWLGTVVAGNDFSGFTYMVDSASILSDIKRHFPSLEVKLPRTAGLEDDAITDEYDLQGSASVDKGGDSGSFYQKHTSRPSSEHTNLKPGWEEGLTTKFRQVLSTARMAKINRSSPASSAIANLPLIPVRPSDVLHLRFRSQLMRLSEVPLRNENPGALDEALKHVPLDRIFGMAGDDLDKLSSAASAAKEKPRWEYADCVIRALLKWFKNDFFTFVNNPICGKCGRATKAMGMCAPNAMERAFGAQRVELYKCTSPDCEAYERFPRYTDPFVLMETRRGRVGEFASCFGMLCRVMGAKVRWVWNAEDHVWTEVYSEYRKRWIHVDACEEAFDIPRLYTQGWNKKLSYCIAFSVDGATDVTSRYCRVPNRDGLPRTRCPEATLRFILDEIRQLRRKDLSNREIFILQDEDAREAVELREYFISGCVEDLVHLGESPRDGRKAVEARQDADLFSSLSI